MSWVAPKTFWLRSDYINVADYNRWKNNVEYLYNLLVLYKAEYSFVYQSGYEIPLLLNVSQIPNDKPNAFFTAILIFEGESGEVYREEYKVYENGAYDFGTFVCPEDGTATFISAVTDGCDYFDLLDMGSDKVLNDYWYADEVNAIIDNLQAISEAVIGSIRGGLPIYSDNGNTPTAEECNAIEGLTLYLYNQIVGGTYTMYLGTGYTGSRIANILL